MIIIITITVFLLFWAGPRPGQDNVPPQAEQVPDSEHHNTQQTAAAEQLRTSSPDIHAPGEDDMQTVGPAEGAGLEVDTEYDMYMDEEEVTNDTGSGTEVEHEGSSIPAGRGTVGVSEGVRTCEQRGERPPATRRWRRVLARVMWTPRHWTCDPATCQRHAATEARRIERGQLHLLFRI